MKFFGIRMGRVGKLPGTKMPNLGFKSLTSHSKTDMFDLGLPKSGVAWKSARRRRRRRW